MGFNVPSLLRKSRAWPASGGIQPTRSVASSEPIPPEPEARGLETRPIEGLAATTEEQGGKDGEKYSRHPRSRNLLVSARPQLAPGPRLTTSTDAALLERLRGVEVQRSRWCMIISKRPGEVRLKCT